MEPISAVAGLFAISLECINSARELYDMRARYKDASTLITTIYSESMIVASSLSQLNFLFQSNKHLLQDKPELLSALDTALTSCRVVYASLHEDVRVLGQKVEDGDLGRMDRLKWSLREPSLKDLLEQIRGQQQALGLLIQGLQMESLSDIKKLVQKNSVTLQQIASRSKSLRESHPNVNVRVPDSIYRQDSVRSIADVQSVLTEAEFEFDDEVINSRAYRRAMRIAEARAHRDQKRAEDIEDETRVEVVEGDLVDLTSPTSSGSGRDEVAQDPPPAYTELWGVDRELKESEESEEMEQEQENEARETHGELFDYLETGYLPFMPPGTPSLSRTPTRETGPEPKVVPEPKVANPEINTVPEPMRTGSGAQLAQKEAETAQSAFDVSSSTLGQAKEEQTPQLPPRPRAAASMPVLDIHKNLPYPPPSISLISDGNTSIKSTHASSIATISSRAQTEQPRTHFPIRRKPLGLHSKPSSDILRSLSSDSTPQIRIATPSDIAMHNIWASLVKEEESFIDRVSNFRRLFYDAAIQKWPALEKHIDVISAQETLVPIHTEELLVPIKEQLGRSSFARCSPASFEAWVTRVQRGYRAYFRRVPHAENAIRATLDRDKTFAPWLNGLGLSILWFGKGWEEYLRLPISQLDGYVGRLEELVQTVEKMEGPQASRGEIQDLERALDGLRRLRNQCCDLFVGAQRREEIQTLYRRIRTTDADFLDRLGLLDERRVLVHQGRLAVRRNETGPWQAVHVVLMDNFLFWGQVKMPKGAKEKDKDKEGDIWVLDAPIPTSSMLLIPAPKNFGSIKTTMKDDLPRRTVLYQFSITDKASKSTAHSFAAFTYTERNVWFEKIEKVVRGDVKVEEVVGEMDASTRAVELETGKGVVEMEGRGLVRDLPEWKA